MNLSRALLTLGICVIGFCSLVSKTARAADIIYIGDSHSTGGFGEVVDAGLRKIKLASGQAAKVVSLAACGSATSDWLKSRGPVSRCGVRACDASGECKLSRDGRVDPIMVLLGKEEPKVVVVALGTNMLKARVGDAINDAKAMIEKIKDKGAECVWVGPPQAALSYMPETRFKDFVEKFSLGIEEAGCRYVSSLDKTDRGNINDSMGLHYSKKDAERWGEKVAKELGPLVDAALTAVRPQAPATSEAPVR